MRDKKIEQNIIGIALIIILGAFIFNTPIHKNNPKDTNDTLLNNVNSIAQQKKDSCLSFEFDENLDYRFMFEKNDSLFNYLNTQRY